MGIARDVARGRRGDGDRARAHHGRRAARAVGRGRARARHPGHAAHERHDADRRRARSAASRSCSARSRSRGSPTASRACGSCGSRRSAGRVATALNGLVVNPFQLFCTRRRRRVRPGLLGAGVRVAAHRHVPDPGPGARVLAVLARRSRSACCSGRSSRARSPTAAGGDRRLALDVHRARDRAAAPRAHLARWCCANRHAAATSRSSCSARCSTPAATQDRAAGLDVDRLRADEEDQDLLLHLHRHRRARVRARRGPDAARPAARRQLRLRRVHARLDALAHVDRVADRDPARRPARTTGCSARTRCASSGSPERSSSATALLLFIAMRLQPIAPLLFFVALGGRVHVAPRS